MKLLFVCLGNICRSPMAEGIVAQKLADAGLDVEIDSAGTSNYHISEAPDKRALKNMQTNKTPIDHLRARQFSVRDFDRFDRIFVMDKSNYADVASMARSEADKKKIEMFLNLSHPGENLDVPDPYFGGDEGFQEVYEMLSRAADVLIDELREQ